MSEIEIFVQGEGFREIILVRVPSAGTVRDLLIHRSGLRDVSGGTIWYGADRDRAEVARRLRYLRPVSGFRERYAYQNVMYLVAGELIPVLTGRTWDAFARERLFAPLGMAHAVLQLDSSGTPVGSRGMLATARDWTRFGQLLIKSPSQQIKPSIIQM